MATQVKKRRITVKEKCANPLFEKWLSEWAEQAKNNDSKMQYTFRNALKTLKKYPIQLNSAKECLILKGFGKTLCGMLDKKLQEYKRGGHNVDLSQPLRDTENIEQVPSASKQAKKKQKAKSPDDKRPYLPAKRSGPYAILITLMKKSQEMNYSGSLTKDEIIEYGRNLCDKSFTKPDPGSFYTSWSSMKTLISKGLVLRNGSPPKFSLTDEGELTAIKLLENDEADGPEPDMNDYIARSQILNSSRNEGIVGSQNENAVSQNSGISTSEKYVPKIYSSATTLQNAAASNVGTLSDSDSEEIVPSQASSAPVETVIFAPRTFDVILLVDTQETTGGTRKPSDDETISELQRLNVNFEVRHLNVGDFTWICREKTSKEELILPYIVERKRMDDFGHSIKDGRFHEQKFRLKQCGIQNLIYIVESYGNNTRTVLPLASLMQGATNTLVQDQFQVRFTENQRHSMQYLSGLTLMLKHIYEDKTLMSCPKESLTPSDISEDLISLMTFKECNKGASKAKKFKVKDVFIRQLLQLKGVSVEKAIAIVEKYPTPKLLKMEYDRLNSQGEKLLSTITYGPLKKAIGPVISRTLYQLYTTDKLS